MLNAHDRCASTHIELAPPLKTDWSDQRHLATAAAMCGRLIKLIAKKINMLKPKKNKKLKRAKAEIKNQLGKQWHITNYAIDMGIIIIFIIMHIQGLLRQLSWVACAAVLIWFWNWVLVWFFFSIFCWYFLFGSCCVFIFLEAHYLTAARWTKNENWPKSRHINHQSSRTHSHQYTHTHCFLG